MGLFTPLSNWKSEEHELFAESVRRLFADEVTPNIGRWDEQGFVDRGFWTKAGDAGLIGGSVPDEYGGSGGGIGFDSVVLYEQGRAGDSAWGYGIQSIVVHYILAFGSEEQKQRWIPGLVSGGVVGALAMSEPGCGSDVQSIRTAAVKDGNQYRISGAKTFITNGGSADLVVLAAKTDSSEGARGVSLIVVETDGLEGFRRGGRLRKLGQHGNDTAELAFEDAKVPLTNLLGPEEGKGFYQLMKQLPWERLLIGISALGAIDFAIGETVRYVQERKAFGKRIMDFQNTRFKLAEMKTHAEILRSFLNDCIARLEAGQLDSATASMAKYWGSETQNRVMHECLQLFGGYGYTRDYPIAKLFADARVQMIYGGTNEIMKELIARSIDK